MEVFIRGMAEILALYDILIRLMISNDSRRLSSFFIYLRYVSLFILMLSLDMSENCASYCCCSSNHAIKNKYKLVTGYLAT